MNDLERATRATLQAIAEDAGSPAGPITAERAVDRYRRDRRRRAGLLAAGAATALIAVGLPSALATWTAPAERGDSAVAVDAPTEPSPTPTSAQPTPQPESAVGAPVPGQWETGPADPEVGVAYPFDLHTHCGIRWTSFGGREWRAVEPAPEPADGPDDDGTVSYDGYTIGTMTLLDEDLLRFTVTDPFAEGRGQTFDFVPMTDTDSRPLCE
jgi:hypothetical protein